MNGSRRYRGVGLLAVIAAAVMVGSLLVPAAGALTTGPPSIPSDSSSTSVLPTTSPAPGPSLLRSSPHPGTIDDYELVPDGAATEDPDVLYDTVSEEAAMNVFQTLVAYQGNSTTNFLPNLATCVPGSSQCLALYGSSLVQDNSTTGAPEFYTFPIGDSQFYDPSTDVSWQVWPSDVMFSVARSQIWSDPSGVTGGWDTAQTLLPNANVNPSEANPSWDGGLHYPYNNTPQHSLTSMLVNDSAYCPAVAMNPATGNGCVTFNVWGGNTSWPFFMQALTQMFAGVAVLPCGWYTEQGAGVPGFTLTAWAASHDGDGPCLLPGGTTSTNTTAFRNAVANMAPTAWDATQELLLALYPAPEPNVQWNIVGSGEYYLVPNTINPSLGYQLEANPAWVQPNCVGVTGCAPAPGTYQGKVNVYWEDSDTVGLQEYTIGQADLAGIADTHTSDLLNLVDQGKVQYFSTPSLSIFFWAFTMNFSASGLQGILPEGDTFNIPSDFFASVATRQLSVTSWPYATYQNDINTVDGVEYGIQYGGAIPYGEEPYYPANISWPSGDPVFNASVAGSAAWWWAQGTDPSSPYYSADLAACTPSNPCIYPILGQLGNPGLDSAVQLYIAEIENVTQGALQPYSYDLTFAQAVIYAVSSSQFNSPLDLYTLGWIPDYPDPSNNIGAMYVANSTYTTSDTLYQQWAMPQYNAPGCGHSNYTAYANLTYWAGQTAVPQDCQGPAYQAMNYWSSVATNLGNLTQRIVDYNLIEHIANDLALYIYFSQTNLVESSAPWIDQWSLNANVMIGGAADNLFAQITYARAQPTYAVTFYQSGLPAGTRWSVTLGGRSANATATSLIFTEPNGTFNFTVGTVPGYDVTPFAGTLTVNGSATNQSVVYSLIPPTTYAVVFNETGLPAGTSWSVSVGNSTIESNSTSLQTELANGTYSFTVTSSNPSYLPDPSSGRIEVSGTAQSFLIRFSYHQAVAATFHETGLPRGSPWVVLVNGVTLDTNGSSVSYIAPSAGNYTYFVTALAEGWTASPNSGVVQLTNSTVTVNIAFSTTIHTYSVYFTASGIYPGTEWSVTFNGTVYSSSQSVITIAGVPAGTYAYTAGALAGYAPSPSGGEATVTAASLSLGIVYTPVTYALTFTESGLPSGTHWAVLVNGMIETSSNSTIVVEMVPGTYNYTVGAVTGWSSAPSSGTVVVTSSGVTVAVTFSPHPERTPVTSGAAPPAGPVVNVRDT